MPIPPGSDDQPRAAPRSAEDVPITRKLHRRLDLVTGCKQFLDRFGGCWKG
jgi:hypothetical protein